MLRTTFFLPLLTVATTALAQMPPPDTTLVSGHSVAKAGGRLSVRDAIVARATAAPADRSKTAALPALAPAWAGSGSDRRINARALDSIQTIAGTRPFVNTSVAEGTIASFRSHLVSAHSASGVEIAVGDNSALSVIRNDGLAYSYSSDGGRHWDSAYLPPLPGSSTSLGFGSVAADRFGNFYIGGIGVSADNQLTVSVNKSADRGRNFAAAVAVDAQGQVDKAWLATGPNPRSPQHDNVYLAWVSFDAAGASVLRFARSGDGGRSYSSHTVFAPPPDAEPANPQNVVQFPMIATDSADGRLYIALLQFGFVAQDYLRIFTSDDGGESFRALAFNVPGAPNAQVYPVTQPGTFSECGAARQDLPDGQAAYYPNNLLTLHSGADLGGSASGLPRFQHATRVNLQPVLAVSKGNLHLAWSNSTSTVFGAADAGARIHYLRSRNNGASWSAPLVVDRSGADNARQVLPAIALGRSKAELESPLLPAPGDVHIAYSVQMPDGSLVRRLARSTDRGDSFAARNIRQLSSVPSTLAPSNIPLADARNAYRTTHYNRMKGACVSLGDYAGIAVDNHTVHSVWGDSGETLVQPLNPLDPISGQPHARENVYYSATPVR